MSENFNKLSEAEAERLAFISEEAGELIQAIAKIQRHGFESRDPTNPNHNGNRYDLAIEMADVVHAIQLSQSYADIHYLDYAKRLRARPNMAGRYLHHNDADNYQRVRTDLAHIKADEEDEYALLRTRDGM